MALQIKVECATVLRKNGFEDFDLELLNPVKNAENLNVTSVNAQFPDVGSV